MKLSEYKQNNNNSTITENKTTYTTRERNQLK